MDTWLVGDPFFRAHYITFDMTNKRVAIFDNFITSGGKLAGNTEEPIEPASDDENPGYFDSYLEGEVYGVSKSWIALLIVAILLFICIFITVCIVKKKCSKKGKPKADDGRA